MFLLYIQVNIQKWSQFMSHLLWPSYIPYQILSGGYFTHSNLQQIQTQHHLNISSYSNIYCWSFMLLISPIGRLIGPIFLFQCVLLRSLIFTIIVQSCLPSSVFREIEFQNKTQQPEIAPNPVTSRSLFTVYYLVWNILP